LEKTFKSGESVEGADVMELDLPWVGIYHFKHHMVWRCH
jgi:hypothetical protein